jgi:succinyl-CoA synthetase beta subunit
MFKIANRSSRRFLSIHEHSSMELLKAYGITVARGNVARTSQEAVKIAKDLKSQDIVVKAQVLAGGRGKGHFLGSGLKGGVKMAYDLDQVKTYAQKMLNYNLVTKQTGEKGRKCEKVFVVERVYVRREYYFALVMDRKTQGPVIIASSQGFIFDNDLGIDFITI